jgi:hypothetical protein
MLYPKVFSVMIVPVSDKAMELLFSKKAYFFPRSHIRKADLICFYEVSPVSAVRYCAEIDSYSDDAEQYLSFKDKVLMFRDPSRNASMIKLKDIYCLETPIKKIDRDRPIRSRMYVSLDTFREASKISDLFTTMK